MQKLTKFLKLRKLNIVQPLDTRYVALLNRGRFRGCRFFTDANRKS